MIESHSLWPVVTADPDLIRRYCVDAPRFPRARISNLMVDGQCSRRTPSRRASARRCGSGSAPAEPEVRHLRVQLCV